MLQKSHVGIYPQTQGAMKTAPHPGAQVLPVQKQKLKLKGVSLRAALEAWRIAEPKKHILLSGSVGKILL